MEETRHLVLLMDFFFSKLLFYAWRFSQACASCFTLSAATLGWRGKRQLKYGAWAPTPAPDHTILSLFGGN